jgi:acyl-CoA thioester hydrolase
MSILFAYPLLIKEHHLDTFGHVNNATYLALFEEARWEFVTDNGYGLQKMIETGLAPTILEVKLRFLKEIRLRDEVVIQTQIPPYKGKIGMILQTIMRGAEVCCNAEFTMALFDLKERKIVPPTPEWLKAIGL